MVSEFFQNKIHNVRSGYRSVCRGRAKTGGFDISYSFVCVTLSSVISVLSLNFTDFVFAALRVAFRILKRNSYASLTHVSEFDGYIGVSSTLSISRSC